MKENLKKLFICFLVAFICITICSKNSFLYAFNDWVDGNAFFTMGKGWMNGLIPYKDLFEQKGPILYLLYGLGTLISNSSFIGIYFLEIISFSFFLYYAWKLSSFYLKKEENCFLILLLGSIVASSISFVQGGSAEEFCLPFLSFSCYEFFKYIKNNSWNKKSLFFNGFVAGIVALIKFNLLGFWFIWMAFLFFRTIFEKKYKEAFLSCIYFLIGMFLPILVFCIYFFLVGGLKDFLKSYILFNINSYTVKETFLKRIYKMVITIKEHMLFNPIICILTLLGFFHVIVSKEKYHLWEKLFVIFSYIFLCLGIYFGTPSNTYYYLLNEFYIIFGILAFLNFFEKLPIKNSSYFLCFFICCVISAFFLSQSNNLNDLSLKKEDYVQYKFDQKIKQVENASLLNYDALDGGFYTYSNILPSTKYFMMQNVSYDRFPDILDEQNRMIKEKQVDFVIVREYYANIGYYETIDFLVNNYDLIVSEKKVLEGVEFTYYLYQKKN